MQRVQLAPALHAGCVLAHPHTQPQSPVGPQPCSALPALSPPPPHRPLPTPLAPTCSRQMTTSRSCPSPQRTTQSRGSACVGSSICWLTADASSPSPVAAPAQAVAGGGTVRAYPRHCSLRRRGCRYPAPCAARPSKKTPKGPVASPPMGVYALAPYFSSTYFWSASVSISSSACPISRTRCGAGRVQGPRQRGCAAASLAGRTGQLCCLCLRRCWRTQPSQQRSGSACKPAPPPPHLPQLHQVGCIRDLFPSVVNQLVHIVILRATKALAATVAGLLHQIPMPDNDSLVCHFAQARSLRRSPVQDYRTSASSSSSSSSTSAMSSMNLLLRRSFR